jgi:hypothetical protein
MFELMVKSKPNFIVTYNGGVKTRKIGWSEFFANVQNANYRLDGALPTTDQTRDYIFHSSDSTRNYTADPSVIVLDWNDEDYTWKFWVKYVPYEYPLTTAYTYTSRCDISLPVYEYDGTVTVTANYKEDVVVPYNAVPYSTQINDDIARAINDKWTLTATYNRLGDKKNREVTIVKEMFNGVVSGINGVKVDGQGLSVSTSIESQLNNSAVASGTQVYEKGWALPLKFMVDVLEEEDTVQVTLTATK